MSRKDRDNTHPNPEPAPPQQLSDLPPKAVTNEDGNLIKGGPKGPAWIKPLT